MGANNWTTCPRCNAMRDAEIAAVEADVAKMYGTVPIEEFDQARANLAERKAKPVPDTFREDYEFWGAADGVVHAEYGGSCNVCGLKARMKHELTFWPEPGASS